jgi:flagellar motility protein MotE (MotC chaperone)
VKKGKDRSKEKDSEHDSDPPKSKSAKENSHSFGSGLTDELLKEQIAVLKAREEKVSRREGMLDLILQDIRSERDRIESFRKEISKQMAALIDQSSQVDTKVGELTKKDQSIAKSVSDLEKRREDLKKKQAEITKEEQSNIIKLASLYDGMAPENAAKILQEMANGGKLDMAARVMASMKDRNAAKVLAEVSDTTLAAQLSQRIIEIKRTPASSTTGGQ